jgi:hypothetical protein
MMWPMIRSSSQSAGNPAPILGLGITLVIRVILVSAGKPVERHLLLLGRCVDPYSLAHPASRRVYLVSALSAALAYSSAARQQYQAATER